LQTLFFSIAVRRVPLLDRLRDDHLLLAPQVFNEYAQDFFQVKNFYMLRDTNLYEFLLM
jgi:hypothetical protein